MTVRDSVQIALFCAMTAALGLVPAIPIPFSPVPITAQTLGVMLSGALLGAWRGTAAMLLFMALVAIGAPLLAGGRGGLAVFFGPTAGFFLAFPLAAFVIGVLTERFWARLGVVSAIGINLIGGVLVVYALGIPLLAVIAKIPLTQAALGSIAFVPGDILKACAAAAITLTVRRGYPNLRGDRYAADSGRSA